MPTSKGFNAASDLTAALVLLSLPPAVSPAADLASASKIVLLGFLRS